VDASLRRLGTDYIDLYQMHHWDPVTPLEETLTALDAIVQEGKARYIGVSNYTGAELKSACSMAAKRNLTAPISSQSMYHLLKPGAEHEVFPVCHGESVGAIIYGALARGILAGRYRGVSTPPVDSRAESSARVRADLEPTVVAILERLAQFATLQGFTVGQLAIAWVLRRPEVSTVLIGVRGEDQLRDNIPAADRDLTTKEIAEIAEIVGDPGQFDHLALGSSPPPN
jgi:aryl-alcohol dehydrogenase-like predicted oxidoreductase